MPLAPGRPRRARRAQTRPPDRVVAVDTGSTDDAARLLRDALRPRRVLDAPADSVVRRRRRAPGWRTLPPAAEPDEWVWLLHDDSDPGPRRARAAARRRRRRTPTADVLGPKLREWPSLRRLLEVGVTISGTGRRETGLERGEYDQGQHDEVRDVLAVNTAGMLVRRAVLEAARASTAGCRSSATTSTSAGGRRAPATGPSSCPRRSSSTSRRRTAASAAPSSTPVSHPRRRTRAPRPLHAAGQRLRAWPCRSGSAPAAARQPAPRARPAAGPGAGRGGRRARRAGRRVSASRPGRASGPPAHGAGAAHVPHREVRHLLAPWWMPYRHGLDFRQRRRRRRRPPGWRRRSARAARRVRSRSGPGRAAAGRLDDLLVPSSVLVPRVVAGRALLAGRPARGRRPAAGAGRRRPLVAPVGRPGTRTRHRLGRPRPGRTSLPLALLGTLLLGNGWLVVDLLFLLAVPLASSAATGFLRRVTASGRRCGAPRPTPCCRW